MTKQTNHSLLLGAHISVSGGFEQAIIRGESIHCTAIQIFTKSNRMWHARPISPESAHDFKAMANRSSIQSIIAHASYLINIGSNKAEIHEKSQAALLEELNRCHTLGIPYLVIHPGSRGTDTQESTLKRIASTIDSVFEQFEGNTKILLENMAGQGSAVCSTWQDLAHVHSLIKHKERVGFCIDTCHAFAAGYDFRTQETYTQFWKLIDETIGIQHIKAIHINDSKKELGSRVDRHEDIGEGLIGLEGFALLFNDEKLFDIPKILETPRDELSDYVRNMQIIRGLITEKTWHTMKR